MSRRRRWVWGVGFGAALLGLAGGVLWLQAREATLNAAPVRRAGVLTLPPQESAVALGLRVPIALLRRSAERAMPESFHLAAEPGTETPYDITIRRGAITLADGGERLRATLSLEVAGTAGTGGGLARLLGLDRNPIDAAADVVAEIGVGLDEGWCPKVDVAVDYRWTRSPRLEIVGGWWIGIEDRVRGQVQTALAGLPAQVEALLPCKTVREQALALWDPRSIRVQLPAAPPLFVGIAPQSVGLSEVAVEARDLRVVLGVRARTTIGSTPPPKAPPGFLPPLEALPAGSAARDGRLRLSIPVRAGYDMIRDWLLREFGGQDIPLETPLGAVGLRVTDIFVYPSAPAITLDIGFRADLPGRWPDTAGRVTVSAEPVLEQGGTRVRLRNVAIGRDVDSLVWSLVTLAFEEQIRAWVEQAAVYDLKPLIDGAMAELRRRLSDPAFTGGLKVTLTRPALRLERVVPENDALAILGTAEAGVEAEVTALPVP